MSDLLKTDSIEYIYAVQYNKCLLRAFYEPCAELNDGKTGWLKGNLWLQGDSIWERTQTRKGLILMCLHRGSQGMELYEKKCQD